VSDELKKIVSDLDSDKTINSLKWETVSIQELYQQMDLLNSRYQKSLSFNNKSISEQILLGIQQLKQTIEAKDTEKSKYSTIVL